MPIIFRNNPIPTTGALYVTNPGIPTRDNGKLYRFIHQEIFGRRGSSGKKSKDQTLIRNMLFKGKGGTATQRKKAQKIREQVLSKKGATYKKYLKFRTAATKAYKAVLEKASKAKGKATKKRKTKGRKSTKRVANPIKVPVRKNSRRDRWIAYKFYNLPEIPGQLTLQQRTAIAELLTPITLGGKGTPEQRREAKRLAKVWKDKSTAEARQINQEMSRRAQVRGERIRGYIEEREQGGTPSTTRRASTTRSGRQAFSLDDFMAAGRKGRTRASVQKSVGSIYASLAPAQKKKAMKVYLETSSKAAFAAEIVYHVTGLTSKDISSLYSEINSQYKNNPKRRNPMAKKTSKKTGNWKGRMMKYQTFSKRLAGCGLTPSMRSQLWQKYKKTGKLPALAKLKKKTSAAKSGKSSAFANAGVTLRRLGYKGKLSLKSLSTLAGRKKKIKALRAKGATMKAYEGVKRASSKKAKGSSSQKTKVGQQIQALRRKHGMSKIKLASAKYDTLAKRRAELKKLKDQLAGKAPKKKSRKKSTAKKSTRATSVANTTPKQMWDMYRKYRMKHSALPGSSQQRMKAIQRDWKVDKPAIIKACEKTRKSYRRCMVDLIERKYTTFSAKRKKVRKGGPSVMLGPVAPSRTSRQKAARSISKANVQKAILAEKRRSGISLAAARKKVLKKMGLSKVPLKNPMHGMDGFYGAQGAALSTPFAFLDGIIDSVQDAVSDLPIVGMIAPYVKPVGLGLLVAGVHYVGGRYLGPQIQKVPALQGLDKYGYTLVGVATAAVIKLAQHHLDLFESVQADQVATLAVVTGAFVDGLDYFRGQSGQTAIAGVHMNGAHLNGAHMGYGDGQYFLAPMSQGTQAPLRRHMRQLAAPTQSSYSAVVAPLSGAADVAGAASGYGALMFTGAGF